MEEKVISILRVVLDDELVDADTSQGNCDKWDSMAQLNLAVEIEAAFNVSLEPEQIAEMRSVQDIVRILSGMKK